MIPFSRLRDELLTAELLQRATVDNFVRFRADSSVTITYRNKEVDISATRLS